MGYSKLTPESRAILDGFPTLSAEELSKVNDLFEHYVFYESTKDGRRLWTSCCGQREKLFPRLQRIENDNTREISYGKHNDEVTCPYCGREATLKCVGRLGRKTRLSQYIPVLFLHEKNSDIYAQGYWVRKTYDDLAQEPHYSDTWVYHFTPGKATAYYQDYHNEWSSVTEPQKGSKRKITEPFTSGSGMFVKYESYHVIGIEAIEKSAFRYCQYMEWARQSDLYRYCKKHTNVAKYLAAACLYPYALEMLMKNGFRSLVNDLIFQGKKNKDILNWSETDPRKAFGLTGTELKLFMDSKDIGVLRIYKLLKKFGFKAEFETASVYKRDFGGQAEDFLKYCRTYKVKPSRLYSYLSKETGTRCYGGYYSHGNAFSTWKDYITAAEAIGYDLTVDTVLLPKDFHRAHNDATAEHNRRLREQQAAANAAAEAERRRKDEAYRLQKEAEEKAQAEEIEKRISKYTYEADGFIIRPAQSSDEIISEGKALSHCVGGYASRHMDGKLTICFMRYAKKPNVPFLTIEMNTKGELVQIHGYKNERDNGKTIAPDPRNKYSEILQPWLEWIAKGSKRDKDGRPKLPKKKEVKIA